MKATYSSKLRDTSPETQADVLREWMEIVQKDLRIVGAANDHRGEGTISISIATGERERPDWDTFVWSALDLVLARPGREEASAGKRHRVVSS